MAKKTLTAGGRLLGLRKRAEPYARELARRLLEEGWPPSAVRPRLRGPAAPLRLKRRRR